MRRAVPKRFLAGILIATALVSILGCRTKIGKIVANPEQYKNKQVVVCGEVSRKHSIPFFDTAAYVLEDETGEIWILTKKAYLPEVGQRLKVTGVVEAGIRVGPKEFGLVISEQEKEVIGGR